MAAVIAVAVTMAIIAFVAVAIVRLRRFAREEETQRMTAGERQAYGAEMRQHVVWPDDHTEGQAS